MKRKLKRTIAALSAVTMMFTTATVLPEGMSFGFGTGITAIAAGTEQQATDEASVTINGETLYYATLEEAFSAADGKTATITMLNDAECTVTSGTPISVKNQSNITLNMNGKTLSGHGTGESGIITLAKGSLSVQGPGTMKSTNQCLNCQSKNAKMTVENITFDVSEAYYGVYVLSSNTVTLNNVQIIGRAKTSAVCQSSNSPNVTINNMNAIEAGYSDVVYKAGTLKINGGTFDKISVTSNNTGGITSVSQLLGEGCTYRHTNKTWATADELNALEISNVTVEKIPLTINPQAETSWYYNSAEHSLQMNAVPTTAGNDITYEWYDGDTKLECVSDAYTIPKTMSAGNYNYTCKATCDCYTLSHEFTFTVEECKHENVEIAFNINGFGNCPECSEVVFQPAVETKDTYDINNDGIKDNVYEISNAGQLYWFAGLVNGTLTDGTSQNQSANAVLTADIDLSGMDNWTPIGNETNQYTGTFDGRNHTIKDMSITKQGNNSGLFGYIANAAIKNITISGKITIIAESYTEGYGSIAGRMDNSTVINCHSSVNITITEDSAIDTTKNNCIGHIGGIVGKMHEENSAISDCSYSGTIELNDRPVNVAAGIAGYAFYSAVPITNCNFTGTIHSTYSGATIIGGIFGYTNRSADVKVTNCLSVGTISKSEDISLTGILIGQINGGYGNNAVKNNYYSSSSLLGVFGTITGTPSTTPAEACTTDELNSGKIAYLLSQGENGSVWGQTLGTDNYPVLDSTKKVYQNETYAGCEGNPGEPVKTEYSNTQLDPVYADHTDGDEDGKCDTCSKYMDNIGARLVGHSLTLDGSVGVNFYMELSSEVISDSSAYMEFTLPGGKTSTVKVSEAPTEVISGTTYYKFKCQVNATAMTDTITAQIKSTVGNSKVYEYTVKEYADYLFAHKENNAEFAKAAELIEAMVNYGSYAQIYAGYNTEKLAVGDVNNLKSLDDVLISEYYEPSIYETKVQFAGANLSLLSTTTLRMYFQIINVEANEVQFGYQGQLLEMKQSGDYYYVELVGIPASKLDDKFCIDVYDGSTNFQVIYSPMAYCTSVVTRATTETRTEDLKNLIKALVLYNQAADAYISED